MPTSPWKPLPKDFPTDGATVWVTPANDYNPPYKAVWDAASQTFTDILHNAVAPWWTISRWKPI